MKILTFNIPEDWVSSLDSLIGDNKIYPSRSEIVRVAVREYLKQELLHLVELNEHLSMKKIEETKPRIYKTFRLIDNNTE